MGNGVDRLLVCALLMGALSLPGCERRDPTPAFSRDLGDGDVILLPPPPPWKNSQIATGGNAEWHPFRELGGEDSGAADAGGVEGAAAIQAEIRELISDFNALVSDEDFEEMQYYFVEKQRSGFDGLIKGQSAVAAKVGELGELLKQKVPDSVATIDGIIKGQLIGNALVLEVADLSVKDANLVVGRLEGDEGSPLVSEATREIRFRVVDDEWLIDWPMLDESDALIEALQAGAEQIQPLISLVESGTIPAEQVVQQLEAAMSMLAPSQGDGAGDDTADAENDDGEEDDATVDEQNDDS